MYVLFEYDGWYFKYVLVVRKVQEVLRRQIKVVYVRKCQIFDLFKNFIN